MASSAALSKRTKLTLWNLNLSLWEWVCFGVLKNWSYLLFRPFFGKGFSLLPQRSWDATGLQLSRDDHLMLTPSVFAHQVALTPNRHQRRGRCLRHFLPTQRHPNATVQSMASTICPYIRSPSLLWADELLANLPSWRLIHGRHRGQGLRCSRERFSATI